SIKKQKRVLFEVILIDDCPNNPLNRNVIKKKYSFVRYILNKNNLGLSKSLNKGINLASGKYVLILHDDCVLVGNDWLKRIIQRLEEKDVGAIIGEHVIEYEKLSLINKVFSFVYGLGIDIKDSTKKGFEEVKHLGDKCDAFKKSYLLDLGAFDESFKTAGEDTELSSRILKDNKKILINHDAKVIHLFSETERQSSILTHMKKAIQLNQNGVNAFLKTGSKYKLDMFFVWLLLAISFFGFVPYLALSVVAAPFALPLALFSIIFVIVTNYFVEFGFVYIPLIYLFGKSFLKAKSAFINKKEFNLLPLLVLIFSMIWDLLAGLAWAYGIICYIFGKLKSFFRI
ncbi:MAG TPA: glycosyltransferase, partial [archaeon]|nr:glycosyltransferase [archaeon]